MKNFYFFILFFYSQVALSQGFQTFQGIKMYHPEYQGQFLHFIPPQNISSYSLTFPNQQGQAQSILLNNGMGVMSWITVNNLTWGLNGNSNTNSSSHYLGTSDLKDLLIKTNAIERMRFLANGNIGINQIAPASKLHILDTVTSAARGLLVEQQGNNDISARINLRKARGYSPALSSLLKDDVIGTLSFGGYNGTGFINNAHIAAIAEQNFNTINTGTGISCYTTCLNSAIPTEKLRITADGNVGIGCSNPSYRLQVLGDIAAENGQIRATSATISTSISSCSDIRFKKNIQPIENPMENLKQLSGVTYSWKTDEFPSYHFNSKPQIGLIAQEVEKFYPQLVETNSEGYKSVDYAKFTPILLEAIKQLQLKIEYLEKEVGKNKQN